MISSFWTRGRSLSDSQSACLWSNVSAEGSPQGLITTDCILFNEPLQLYPSLRVHFWVRKSFTNRNTQDLCVWPDSYTRGASPGMMLAGKLQHHPPKQRANDQAAVFNSAVCHFETLNVEKENVKISFRRGDWWHHLETINICMK